MDGSDDSVRDGFEVRGSLGRRDFYFLVSYGGEALQMNVSGFLIYYGGVYPLWNF